jgi:hypothetical protein
MAAQSVTIPACCCLRVVKPDATMLDDCAGDSFQVNFKKRADRDEVATICENLQLVPTFPSFTLISIFFVLLLFVK